jgi:hypothetical protein
VAIREEIGNAYRILVNIVVVLKKLHSEEFHNTCSLINSISVIISKRII